MEKRVKNAEGEIEKAKALRIYDYVVNNEL